MYAELSGVNNIVIDSTDAYQAMLKNLAFTLCLYSGQMCTTSQALLIPAGGIDTDEGHKSFHQLGADLAGAVEAALAKPEVATGVLGAIHSHDTLRRIDEAAGIAGSGWVEDNRHPDFRTPKSDPVIVAEGPDSGDLETLAQSS